MIRIDMTNVTKKYGSLTALRDISVQLQAPAVYGLLGRNGAGKTTMLNLIANRIFPTQGKITVGGHDVTADNKEPHTLYFMSEDDMYPENFSIKKIFHWTRTFYPCFDMKKALALCETFDIHPNKTIKSLSTGYNTIVKIITTLSSGADILFFDEPVLGLDAYHREIFYREVMAHYIEQPKIIVLSTHIIEEIGDMLEKVIILKNRRIEWFDTVENLQNMAYCVSGRTDDVQAYVKNKDVLDLKMMTAHADAVVKGVMPRKDDEEIGKAKLSVSKPKIQQLFIHITSQERSTP